MCEYSRSAYSTVNCSQLSVDNSAINHKCRYYDTELSKSQSRSQSSKSSYMYKSIPGITFYDNSDPYSCKYVTDDSPVMDFDDPDDDPNSYNSQNITINNYDNITYIPNSILDDNTNNKIIEYSKSMYSLKSTYLEAIETLEKVYNPTPKSKYYTGLYIHLCQWQRPRNLDIYTCCPIKLPSKVEVKPVESLTTKKNAMKAGVIKEFAIVRLFRDINSAIKVRKFKSDPEIPKNFLEMLKQAKLHLNSARVYVSERAIELEKVNNKIYNKNFMSAAKHLTNAINMHICLECVVDKLEFESLPILLKYYGESSPKANQIGGELKSMRKIAENYQEISNVKLDTCYLYQWDKIKHSYENELRWYHTYGRNMADILTAISNVSIGISLCALTGCIASPIAISAVLVSLVDTITRISLRNKRTAMKNKVMNNDELSTEDKTQQSDDIDKLYVSGEMLVRIMCITTSLVLGFSDISEIVASTRSMGKSIMLLAGQLKKKATNVDSSCLKQGVAAVDYVKDNGSTLQHINFTVNETQLAIKKIMTSMS